MSNPVISKNGMQLLTPETLVGAVKSIEQSCPGWWWSVSQKKDVIFINMGPGRNCPHGPDNDYALTHHGDRGSSLEYAVNGQVDESNLLESIDQLIVSFNPNRKLTPTQRLSFSTTVEPTAYRRQSDKERISLARIYEGFAKDLKTIEQRGHVLEEVYIGSCDLSADCSLRGKRVDDSAFDISFDLQEEGTIAESMSWAVGELKSDVLTPR